MEKNRRAVASIFAGSEAAAEVTVRGHTDLCLRDVKFAGNSQRRRRHFLLFHGTILLNCDLSLISELLRMPSLQPDYRAGRAHRDFVMNLNVPAEAVKAALTREWGAEAAVQNPPLEEIAKLAREKYSTREWNFKF
jgi:lipoate-protein ligase A